jgi:hypothetical protein
LVPSTTDLFCCKISLPEEAGLSVLKGAVLFGHKPGYIASRVSNGADISPLFDPDKHEQRRKFTSVVEGTFPIKAQASSSAYIGFSLVEA